VWSGWVGIARKTGLGLVSPLPGIWPSLHLDTSITLPVGVEAYAAYALRAWLATEHAVSARTRQFAKWSAIFSFALGMAGQVAYHLLAQAGAARAPWPITTIVSCLPVLVLGMGTALAHMLRADATSADMADSSGAGPVAPSSPAWSPADQAGEDQEPARQRRAALLARRRERRSPTNNLLANTWHLLPAFGWQYGDRGPPGQAAEQGEFGLACRARLPPPARTCRRAMMVRSPASELRFTQDRGVAGLAARLRVSRSTLYRLAPG
jgi:hypothetical protein